MELTFSHTIGTLAKRLTGPFVSFNVHDPPFTLHAPLRYRGAPPREIGPVVHGRGRASSLRLSAEYSRLISFYLSLFTLCCSLAFPSCNPITAPPHPPQVPDTTSHDFIWQIDTLGDGNSSILYDVAIVESEDGSEEIWAVGELYVRDTDGQINPTPYALAKWKGEAWSYETVSYHDFGSTTNSPGPLFAIQVFGPNDVYVCSYANLLHWDGGGWMEKAFFLTSVPFENQIQKMWGSSGQNLYCVGRNGGIFHFSGSTWARIESGTTMRIQDVWGTSQGEVFAVASDKFTNNGVAALRIQETAVGALSVSGLPTTSMVGIWTKDGKTSYVCGDGLYISADPTTTWRKIEEGIPSIYKESVRGNGPNDVFVVGDFGLVLHWNGSTWHEYSGSELPYFQGQYQVVKVASDIVVAVGFTNNGPAVSLIGRRQ